MKHKVLQGNETFDFDASSISVTVKDFWAWSMSRLLADGPRADLAEFIVNTALGVDVSNPKCGWGECDIKYNNVRIEVKCSTYLQAWERSTPSKPTFSIAKTYNCDIEEFENGYRYIGRDGTPPTRRSELYVFCLFAETDRAKANPLILDQWTFFVVPTQVINENFGGQRKVSIRGLQKIGAVRCDYSHLKDVVDRFAGGQSI